MRSPERIAFLLGKAERATLRLALSPPILSTSAARRLRQRGLLTPTLTLTPLGIAVLQAKVPTREAARRMIVKGWAEGLTAGEIAANQPFTPYYVYSVIRLLRKKSVDSLPKRR